MWWPIALKLLYSVLLFGLVGVLSREIYLVWFDDRVFVGRFDVIAEGGGESAESADFARRIVTAQAVLAHQLSDYQRVGEPNSVTDVTFNVAERERVTLPDEALKGIDITIQSVNLTQIFSTLRKGFSSPNEVYGHVTSTSGSVLAAVEWPRAPAPAKTTTEPPPVQEPAAEPRHAPAPAKIETERLTKFYVPAQPTLLASAKYIACSLSWARGAAKEAKLARIPRTQFCDFAMALGDLYDLSEKASTPTGLSADEVARVRRRTEILAGHYNTSSSIPDIYRLRADLIDLLPDKSRTLGDLVDAQEDRLSYAKLDPKIAALPPEEQRFTVLALARPAIPLPNGELRDLPNNWKNLLSRHSENVERAVQSTGLVLLKGESQPIGTAFMVAPNLALTASHVISWGGGQQAGDPPDATAFELCFGDRHGDCTDTLGLSEIHYRGKSDRSTLGGVTDVALIEVDEHSPVFQPPLPLVGPDPAPNTMVGAYAFVIGYPFNDPRLPPPFIDKLLGKVVGVRRILPGRILAYNVIARRYTSDISTTAGTSGAPLVDLSTGAVLAVSFAGEWRGGRGKFAYALQIPPEVRGMIDRRLRGEPIVEPEADPAADAATATADEPPKAP